MKQYLDLLRHIKAKGTHKGDRTGTGTQSVFGYQMRFDLQDGFPLLTTKKLHLRSIIHELLWFLKGESNIKYLQDNDVHIWDEWADENGDLGPVYGVQWRAWERPARFVGEHDFATGKPSEDEGHYEPGQTIDQIANVVQRIKAKPDDRRLIVTAWNPAEIDQMKLPPCHCLFQFYTRELTLEQRLSYAVDHDLVGIVDGRLTSTTTAQRELVDSLGVPSRALDCQLYQRSCDVFLGVPFNIASYALLTMMVAQVCDMVPGEFVWTGGDVHIYSNHQEQTDLQLTREPRALPKMRINPEVKDIFSFKYEDFTLENYDPHPHIAGPVAV